MPALDEEALRDIHLEAIRLGIAAVPEPFPKPAVCAPVSIFASPVPKKPFEEVWGLASVFSDLMDKVSCDTSWLFEVLAQVGQVDDFTGRLIDLAKEIYKDRD